ncbi:MULTISPECIES: hypothetical protein [Leuconostoc]|mgnify:CR=1 FL=1|jgi:hypothetical protein|uniref:hypothetical protein n=1 Tax=Leuconostoc TaxID=1243 RepID=UPI0011DCF1C1|nr:MULTISPECIES: hypothetical protein [Leuconostoc]MBK0041207.1 hypothetical protein [Leuconostoc sp. S51]MBK0052216.1 hypothetical protein [Leuconostoc sp. S50]MBS0957954.1 hypothetical protein [Leuconostoc pseudomesenteroides]MCT4380367.1 hypothetical protein [Leuconostoc pseudomesenteroides]MCT4412751.1 hypothetical protein [Leuconostoc pseudomesenteroides]
MEKSNKQKVRTRLTIGAIIMSAMVWLLFIIFAHHSYVMLSEGFINSVGFPFHPNLNTVALIKQVLLVATAVTLVYTGLMTLSHNLAVKKVRSTKNAINN